MVLPIVTLEHLELDWHRKAVGKRIKSYEVSANSQEADPAKRKLARRGDGELSEQIHQSNQIVQVFQAGTGNACNWAKLEIETKRQQLSTIAVSARSLFFLGKNRLVEREPGERKRARRK